MKTNETGMVYVKDAPKKVRDRKKLNEYNRRYKERKRLGLVKPRRCWWTATEAKP